MTGVVLGSNFFASSAKEEMSPAWMGFAVPLAVKRNNSKMMLEILIFMYHLHCKLKHFVVIFCEGFARQALCTYRKSCHIDTSVRAWKFIVVESSPVREVVDFFLA